MKKETHLVILFSLLLCTINAPNFNFTGNLRLSSVQQDYVKTEFTENEFRETGNILETVSILKKLGGEEGLIINASDYPGQNDTERLQAALDDVPPEGATVLISGVWNASGLIAKSYTTIFGMNGTIRRPDNTTAPFITFENRSDFAVLNLTLDGKKLDDGCGIRIVDGKSFMIQNNTFLNIKKHAVRVTVSLEDVSENFTIAKNSFTDCDNAPILVFGMPTKRAIRHFTILSNTILNGTVNGKIGTAFSADALVANNTVENCQFGIATRCVSNTTIMGNVISNATDYGLYLGTQIGDNGTGNVVIENNSVIGGDIGIARYYGSYPIRDIIIRNNQFINNTSYDILADFPAIYINNTITSAERLVIHDLETTFIGTRTITNELILPGDVNSDLKIDIMDVAFIAKKYGCVEGSPGWNISADIIRDDVIDIKDISYVSRNYGVIM